MCIETNSMEDVDATLCKGIPEPEVTKPCDNEPCLSWQASAWTEVGCVLDSNFM